MNPKIREALIRAVPYLPPDVAEAVVSLLLGETSEVRPTLWHSLNDDMITVEAKYTFNDLIAGDEPMAMMAAGCLTAIIDAHETALLRTQAHKLETLIKIKEDESA